MLEIPANTMKRLRTKAEMLARTYLQKITPKEREDHAVHNIMRTIYLPVLKSEYLKSQFDDRETMM